MEKGATGKSKPWVWCKDIEVLVCSAEGGAQLLLCPGCVCSGRKAVCGEATGSHPQGGGICAQLVGAGGGGMNEPFEWKTLVLSMTFFWLPRRGLCCSVWGRGDGKIPGANIGNVERLGSVRAGPPCSQILGNTSCLSCTLWPTKHSHILDLIYITHHPLLVSGHLCYHHATGKEMHIGSHDQERS